MQKQDKGLPDIVPAILIIISGMVLYAFLTGKFQLCVFRNVTGLPCPGCGLTRAFLSLIQGRWSDSLRFHPFLLPVLFTLFTAFATHLAKNIKLKNIILLKFFSFFERLNSSKYFYTVIFTVIFLFYLYRMFSAFPDGPEPMTFEKASLAGIILSKL